MKSLCLADVYASIHKAIREDQKIRQLMGFSDDTKQVEVAKRIQKRKQPSSLLKGSKEQQNLPVISFYKLPGRRGIQNDFEYETAFDFDVYTLDDVETAIDIADRITELFDSKYLDLPKGSNFKARYVTSAEDDSDLTNVYKYFVQIEFSFGIEEG